MPEPREEHGPGCAGCQILGLMAERNEAEKQLSRFQPLGNGVYRVGGMKRNAVTGRYVVPEILTPEDRAVAAKALRDAADDLSGRSINRQVSIAADLHAEWLYERADALADSSGTSAPDPAIGDQT